MYNWIIYTAYLFPWMNIVYVSRACENVNHEISHLNVVVLELATILIFLIGEAH